jgi:CRISPR-associated protein Cmr4
MENAETTLVPNGCKLKISGSNKVVLEEYAFNVTESEEATEWAKWLSDNAIVEGLSYWKNKLKTDLVILNDDDFRDFVELSTEVITRTQIDNEKGTVKDGALFTEEFLPSDSLLYTLVLAGHDYQGDKKTFPDANATWDFFKNTVESELKNLVQVGGNATLGKGIIRTKIYQNGN